MSGKKRKVLIAAGGTGGHMFPAQALAKQLLSLKEDIEVVFAGAGLKTNRYFCKESFSFRQVSSATFFHGGGLALFSSLFHLGKGVKESLHIVRELQPDIVVGFGSFHSFPILAASLISRIPLVLFESNSVPGKVNRLFSRWAQFSAVQFPIAIDRLKGQPIEVGMPFADTHEGNTISKEEARAHFSLEKDRFTILVFGGSQGSSSINRTFCESIQNLSYWHGKIQVIHITGTEESAEHLKRFYLSEGVPACVKAFEHHMHLAWRAADLVVCRAGAATLAELLEFEVPGILIPFPRASDDHQRKNAVFMQEHIGCVKYFTEDQLHGDQFRQALGELIDSSNNKVEDMKKSIQQFKMGKQKSDLCHLVCAVLRGLPA